MKTIPPRIAGLALIASTLIGLSISLQAQDDGPPSPTPTPSPTPPAPMLSRALSATIDYGNGAVFQPGKAAPDFETFGLRPQQSVILTVQFPAEMAGQAIIAEPLDGGLLSIPEDGLFVGTDGTVVFQFQAGDSPGACRLTVHQTDDMNLLHFWVIDTEHPENNPLSLPGTY